MARGRASDAALEPTPSSPHAAAGGNDGVDDPLRDQLLDAAAKVFAEKGYNGTRVQDIVREAGLSIGAMYGRFDSKKDLLTEAVVRSAVRSVDRQATENTRVADLIAQFAVRHQGPLTETEALHLEAYITAHREPEAAAAIKEARRRRGGGLQQIIDNAIADGSLDPNVDIDAVVFFLDAVHMGMLVQRAAGVTPPARKEWDHLVRTVLAAIARPQR